MTDLYINEKLVDWRFIDWDVLSFDIGTKHLAFCFYKYNYEKLHQIKFGIQDISDKQPLQRLKNLNQLLNRIPRAKTVVIEQQVATNIIAMQIQAALTIYFLSLDCEVKYYNPKDKFKYDKLGSFKGKEHKQISVSYARCILEKLNQEHDDRSCSQHLELAEFEKFKKKDDVADTICMSVMTAYERYNPNPKNEILKMIH